MTKTLREKQFALRENIILDSAYDLMLQQGYQKMSMDELAAHVGIAKMTLYQHFPSKDALAAAVIVRGMKQVEEALLPVFNSNQPALEQLQAVLKQGLEQRSMIWRINLELPLIILLQTEAYQAQNARFVNYWHRLIEQAKREGTVAQNLSTPVLVRMYQALFQTDYHELLSDGQVTIETLIDTLFTVFINGIRK